MTHALVWIDRDYDQTMATDRRSRYRAYLVKHAADFDDVDTSTQFAAAAWRVATEPVMSPGFVRLRPDIRAVTLAHDQDDPDIVSAILDLPVTHGTLRSGSVLVDLGAYDWDQERAYDQQHTCYYPPRAAPGRLIVLPSVQIRIPLDPRQLPFLPTRGLDPAAPEQAEWAVGMVVEQVNAHADTLVAELRRYQ